VDPLAKQVTLCCKAADILKKLAEESEEGKKKEQKNQPNDQRNSGKPQFGYNALFTGEFGSWMVEGTPSLPYGDFTGDLRLVQHNLQLRRQLVEKFLSPNDRIITMSNFPLLGQYENNLDLIVSKAPRYKTLLENIVARRGKKVEMFVPLFQDKKTNQTSLKGEVPGIVTKDGKYIYGDHLAYGVGSHCLQATFNGRSIDEARQLHDYLAIMAPLILAMSAATPFMRGRIADTDVRWNCLCESGDDRNAIEREDQQQLEETKQRDIKSKSSTEHNYVPLSRRRWDNVSFYIGNNNTFKSEYNDVPTPCDEKTYQTLKKMD